MLPCAAAINCRTRCLGCFFYVAKRSIEKARKISFQQQRSFRCFQPLANFFSREHCFHFRVALFSFKNISGILVFVDRRTTRTTRMTYDQFPTYTVYGATGMFKKVVQGFVFLTIIMVYCTKDILEYTSKKLGFDMF